MSCVNISDITITLFNLNEGIEQVKTIYDIVSSIEEGMYEDEKNKTISPVRYRDIFDKNFNKFVKENDRIYKLSFLDFCNITTEGMTESAAGSVYSTNYHYFCNFLQKKQSKDIRGKTIPNLHWVSSCGSIVSYYKWATDDRTSAIYLHAEILFLAMISETMLMCHMLRGISNRSFRITNKMEKHDSGHFQVSETFKTGYDVCCNIIAMLLHVHRQRFNMPVELPVDICPHKITGDIEVFVRETEALSRDNFDNLTKSKVYTRYELSEEDYTKFGLVNIFNYDSFDQYIKKNHSELLTESAIKQLTPRLESMKRQFTIPYIQPTLERQAIEDEKNAKLEKITKLGTPLSLAARPPLSSRPSLSLAARPPLSLAPRS